MADDRPPFYAPLQPPRRAREPRTGELLYEFLRGHDRIMCELFDLGEYGVDVRFSINEEFLYSRRFDSRLDPERPPREMATAWAEQERRALMGND
jgi:hypothetical protein